MTFHCVRAREDESLIRLGWKKLLPPRNQTAILAMQPRILRYQEQNRALWIAGQPLEEWATLGPDSSPLKEQRKSFSDMRKRYLQSGIPERIVLNSIIPKSTRWTGWHRKVFITKKRDILAMSTRKLKRET